MEKFNETAPELKKQRIAYINKRWSQLYSLEKEWGERAMRYLLLTNSGGAIATLSFLGTSKLTSSMPTVIFSLFIFIFGVVLVGVHDARIFHQMSSLFELYKEEVNEYFSDERAWRALYDNDEKRAQDNKWDFIFPYSSFACFIFGCISGSFALFCAT